MIDWDRAGPGLPIDDLAFLVWSGFRCCAEVPVTEAARGSGSRPRRTAGSTDPNCSTQSRVAWGSSRPAGARELNAATQARSRCATPGLWTRHEARVAAFAGRCESIRALGRRATARFGRDRRNPGSRSFRLDPVSRDPLEELFGPLDSDEPETGSLRPDEMPHQATPTASAPTRAVERGVGLPKRQQFQKRYGPHVSVPDRGRADGTPREAAHPVGVRSRPAQSTASRPVPARPGAAAVQVPRIAREELPTQPVPATHSARIPRCHGSSLRQSPCSHSSATLLVVNSLARTTRSPRKPLRPPQLPLPRRGRRRNRSTRGGGARRGKGSRC